MTEFLLNPVVGVFRQCRKCKAYKTLGNYSRRGRICSACVRKQYVGEDLGHATATRTLRITPSGRALLRKWGKGATQST